MLTSQKIARRQSEIRQKLAHLAGVDSPTDEQRSELSALDSEYGVNEQRYRAALIGEDTERRAANDALGDGKTTEWSKLVEQFELRQAVGFLDEGRALSGATAEVVQEMRSAGGYQGVPVPLEALEQRAGETAAAGFVNPVDVKPIIARLFPDSVAARMGGSMTNIGRGIAEYPVTSSAITAGWAPTETGDVAAPVPFTTASPVARCCNRRAWKTLRATTFVAPFKPSLTAPSSKAPAPMASRWAWCRVKRPTATARAWPAPPPCMPTSARPS